MFDVAIDRANSRVVIHVSAFPDIDTIERKEGEIIANVRDIMLVAKHFDLLVALEGLGPVARVVGERMDTMIGRIAAKGLRRSANVGFGAIARMQLQRLTGHDDRFRFFATTDEAKAWLDA